MAHLKNKQLLMCILAVLMLLLTWIETASFQWAVLLFTLTLAVGWVFTLPLIRNRFDEMFANKVNWMVPVAASLWLGLNFWLGEQTHAALLLTLLISWLAALLLFTELDFEKTAASMALPTLSMVVLKGHGKGVSVI